MPTGPGRRCSREELGRIDVNSPVEHLVDRYRIATAATVVEGRQVERLEPRLVGEFADAGDELCDSPLDPFDPLLVRSVKWSSLAYSKWERTIVRKNSGSADSYTYTLTSRDKFWFRRC